MERRATFVRICGAKAGLGHGGVVCCGAQVARATWLAPLESAAGSVQLKVSAMCTDNMFSQQQLLHQCAGRQRAAKTERDNAQVHSSARSSTKTNSNAPASRPHSSHCMWPPSTGPPAGIS